MNAALSFVSGVSNKTCPQQGSHGCRGSEDDYYFQGDDPAWVTAPESKRIFKEGLATNRVQLLNVRRSILKMISKLTVKRAGFYLMFCWDKRQ